jgi:hypothetical protein
VNIPKHVERLVKRRTIRDNLYRHHSKHIEMFVRRRMVRENLYRPEYPLKFQAYVMDFWVRERYADEDSIADLAAVIGLCRTDSREACKRACKLPAQRDTSNMLEEFSYSELVFMLELYGRVCAGDTAYINRILKAMNPAVKPKQKKPHSACELAANLYMELVRSGKRPASRRDFYQLLRQRLSQEGVREPENLRHLLHTIGLYEAFKIRPD